MNSAFPGTVISILLPLTIGIGFPLRKLAKASSSIPSGNGAIAEKIILGSPPRTTDLKIFSKLSRFVIMSGSSFMSVPVHACGFFIIYLHPVNSQVALIRNRVLGQNQAECDEAPAVQRPAFYYREFV